MRALATVPTAIAAAWLVVVIIPAVSAVVDSLMAGGF